MQSDDEKIMHLQQACLTLVGGLISAYGALWKINSQFPPSEVRDKANGDIDALHKKISAALELLKKIE